MSHPDCPCCAVWAAERDRLLAKLQHLEPAYELRCEINLRQTTEIAHLKTQLQRMTPAKDLNESNAESEKET